MKRLKKLVILSHCILNQNSVVKPLARANGAFESIVTSYIKRGYGIYQLPCPELKHLGLSRKPMSKEDYNTKAYKTLCENLVTDVMKDLQLYIEDDVDISYLHGINNSPTCSITGNRGIFMEYFIDALNQNNIEIQMIEVGEKI